MPCRIRCRGESLSKADRTDPKRKIAPTDRSIDQSIETAMNNGDKAPALGQRGQIRRRLRCSQVRSPTWASRHTPNRRGRCGRCIHRTALWASVNRISVQRQRRRRAWLGVRCSMLCDVSARAEPRSARITRHSRFRVIGSYMRDGSADPSTVGAATTRRSPPPNASDDGPTAAPARD